MKHRTAVKTGRAAELQLEPLNSGSFSGYAAVAEQLAGGYVRPLVLRLPPVRHAVKQLPVLAAWILAMLLVAGTFAVGRTPAQDRPPSEDAAITQRVENALAKDPFLRSQEIYVETQDGVVNLSGFVRSLDEVEKAGELARGVRGVSAVRNGLRVANRPSRA